jgi:HD containing hydrolase-like enzyme
MSGAPNFEYYLRAREVTRFHTVPMVDRQNIAAHSHGVAVLGLMLTSGQCSANFLQAALLHDMGEYRTGDIPSPVKRVLLTQDTLDQLEREEDKGVAMLGCGVHPALALNELGLLRFCDAAEGLLTCLLAVRRGDNTLALALRNFFRYTLATLEGVEAAGYYTWAAAARKFLAKFTVEIEALIFRNEHLLDEESRDG